LRRTDYTTVVAVSFDDAIGFSEGRRGTRENATPPTKVGGVGILLT